MHLLRGLERLYLESTLPFHHEAIHPVVLTNHFLIPRHRWGLAEVVRMEGAICELNFLPPKLRLAAIMALCVAAENTLGQVICT